MLVPLSWIKDFVDVDVAPEVLSERMTLAGLEVGTMTYIGIPQQQVEGIRMPTSDHLVWDREKLLLGAIREVKQHPDADRLVLAMVDYGGDELEQCVTGAPNLFAYRDQGPLESPLWTALATEGAEVWDGHSEQPKRMILKGKPLRGIHNKSMVCSEKELGISDEHEGVILMKDAPRDRDGQPFAPGTPLQDVFGDVIYDIDLTPNLARCFSMLGVAREVAALLDKEVREPSYDVLMEGDPITGQAAIEIREPELNPRFTLALLKDVTVRESPFWVQHRLRLVGQRPINNIVDVTNYITFEIGQPLHAFDYDKLVARADGNTPTIITRLPEPDETLETLDEVKRKLEPHNILVTDTAGVLSLGGVIGGAETEISDETTNVLLEAAAWQFFNIRQTSRSQKVFTDAATRFGRGVHPSQAEKGVRRGIDLMRQWGGGTIADGIIDEYPNPPATIQVDLPVSEIERLTGMPIPMDDAVDILTRLQFEVAIEDDMLHVTVPDFRMDISEGVIGQADLVEEIVRIYGYDAIPTTIMDDAMPEQHDNVDLAREELARDVLVALGLRENISYRFTTPEREAELVPPGTASANGRGDYVTMLNPISSDKTVLRQTMLVSLLENARNSLRFTSDVAIFEIGSVYHKHTTGDLPDEPRRLGLLLTGPRNPLNWQPGDTDVMDFFDIKGLVEGLLNGLHIRGDIRYTRAKHPSLHPGRSAELHLGETVIGSFGELHPVAAKAFEVNQYPVMVAEFDLDTLLAQVNPMYGVSDLPITPAILEDIALVVPVDTQAAEVEMVIRQAGGDLLKSVTLFDVYQGGSVPEGMKSLAYSLVYQTDERTLKDKDAAKIRGKIVKAAEKRLGASLRA